MFIVTKYKCKTFMQYKWFMIVKDGCPACHNAFNELKSMGETINYIEYRRLHPKLLEDIRYKYAAGWNTVPLIFYEGNFIGGSTELHNYLMILRQKNR